MKKFVVVLLLIIPLVVLLTITASGKIISAEVAIGIEHFELWHKGEAVTEATVNLGEYKRKKMKFQLIPRYFPTVANVSGFTWSSDNPEVATVDKDGIVTFLDCGFAKVTAISADASSVRSSCSFFVEDDAIHSITLSSYQTGEEISKINLSAYEEEQFRLDVSPYNALAEDPVYLSSDERVFSCLPDGILRANAPGEALLTVRAKGKNGKWSETVFPVKVSGTALVKQSVVYAYGSEDLDLEPYLAAGRIAGGSVISLADIPYGGSKRYAVSDGAREGTVTVVRLTHPHMIGAQGMDALLEREWSDGVFLAANRTMSLSPIDLATSEKLSGVEILSSDPSVLREENGVIKAFAAGKATLTYRKEGYEPFSFEVNVAVPIGYFTLNVDADNDVVGLGSERVYGTRSVYDGKTQEGIRVTPENIYPATGGRTLFAYSVKEDYASVDETGLVTFSEEAIGNPVTVTVKSLFSANAISRTYIFKHIVKGINVGFGYGANPCDVEAGEMPSFDPYYDALKTMYEERDQALVFQTNIYLPSQEEIDAIEGKYHKLCFIRDIYGNGYKIDGQFFQYDFESRIFEEGQDNQLEGYPDQKGITICDLFVNSYAPRGSDSQANFEELMKKGGVPIRTYYKERSDFEITFRYCVFQYAYSHAITVGGTVSFDGCIFRNSAGVSLLVQSLYEQENYISVNNCIFSNSMSMTGLVSNGTFPLPKDEVVRYNAFKWTGTNYIYNWKLAEELRLDIIPKGVMKNESVDALLDGINNKLNECARKSFVGTMNRELTVRHNKEQYVNMGILFISFWSPLNVILNADREKVTDGLKLDLNLSQAALLAFELNGIPLGSIRSVAKRFMDLEHTNYMLTNKRPDGSFNTMPGETYKLNAATYAKLRGEVE